MKRVISLLSLILFAETAHLAAMQASVSLTFSNRMPIENAKEIIDKCPDFTELYLGPNQPLVELLIEALRVGHGPNLKKLSLAFANPTVNQVAEILFLRQNLTELNLDCFKHSFENVCSALHSRYGYLLEKISLDFSFVTADDVQKIFAECPFLIELSLGSCHDTAKGVIDALKKGKASKLKKLFLGYTSTKADQVVEILKLCPELTKLSLYGCPNSAPGVLNALIEGSGQSLELLFLNETQATSEQIELIQKILPSCVIRV